MLWTVSIKALTFFGEPMTYSYQSVLPKLPGMPSNRRCYGRINIHADLVPSLRKTVQRCLESVRPLLNDVEYDRMERLATEFQANEGPRLQFWLKIKSWCGHIYVDSNTQHSLL